MITTVIIFIIVLSVLVFAHEWGHFFSARRFGVKAEEFGFGFPPRAIGFYKDIKGKWRRLSGSKNVENIPEEIAPADTVYSLNWLPIGGFVKIKGQDGEDKDQKDSFGSKKIWQRTTILAAGVIMNIILAFVLFSISFMVGAPKSVETGGHIQITETVKGSPAQQAGILSGDIIKGADGQVFSSVPQVQEYISSKGGSEINLQISRAGQAINIKVKPEVKNDKAIIGIGLDQVDNVRYPFFQAIWEGLKNTGILLWLIIVSFYNLIKDLIIGVSVGDAVSGPIKIAQITGEVVRFGFVNLLNFTAVLSLNLAVINFLPFPALDGGRILFLVIEKIRRKPVKREVEAMIHNIGFLILIGLIILVTYKDIVGMF